MATARYRFHQRVGRNFGRLTRLEKGRESGVPVEGLLPELDEVDRDNASLSVPRGMASPYLELRLAVHDMRDRLRG